MILTVVDAWEVVLAIMLELVMTAPLLIVETVEHEEDLGIG